MKIKFIRPRYYSAAVLSLVLFLSVLGLSGCVSKIVPSPTTPSIASLNAAFQKAPTATVTLNGKTIAAPYYQISDATLYSWIKNKAKGFKVVNVQMPDAYKAGHIPGAINIPIYNIFNGKSYRMLQKYKNDVIVTVCYAGHLQSMPLIYLRALGFDAVEVGYGMSSWQKNYVVQEKMASLKGGMPMKPPVEGSTAYAFHFNDVTKTPTPLPSPGSAPRMNRTVDLNSVSHPTKKYPMGFAASTGMIQASMVYGWIKGTSKPPLPGYVVVDLREPSAYAAGHIPGAINLPVQNILSSASLSVLNSYPKGTKIVLVGYASRIQSLPIIILKALGYNVAEMAFVGMSSWVPNYTWTEPNGTKAITVNKAIDTANTIKPCYPITTPTSSPTSSSTVCTGKMST